MDTTSKQRIALISVHGDPAIEIGKEEAGGQNVYVRNVGEALAQQGWHVDMFTRKASAEQPKIVEHGPRCRTIRLTAGPEEFVPRDEIFGYASTFVEELLKFQQQSGIKYPLVHTNYWISSWVGMELKKRQPLKQVHTYHSLGAVKYKSVTTIPMIASTRLSVPCGTDIRRFGSIDKQPARAALGIDPDALVVFYVGRFDERKGIETLVRAVGQSQLRGNENLKLIIGGGSRPGQSDGKERDRIEGIVAELGMSDFTTFPGRLGDDILPAYYAAADVCVVPSHYEPFGLVAIEAMASGTPVVASDVGGLQFTVLPEETGLLAPPKDDAAFAVAIDRILSNPDWRNQLGKQARLRVEEKFSWDGVAHQLSDLYIKLLKQPAKTLAQASA
jgi:glycosyltransferase involved in cell wall biosynthesis